MQQIQLIHHARRAIRWLPNGKGLPIAWDEACRLLALGRAQEVAS